MENLLKIYRKEFYQWQKHLSDFCYIKEKVYIFFCTEKTSHEEFLIYMLMLGWKDQELWALLSFTTLVVNCVVYEWMTRLTGKLLMVQLWNLHLKSNLFQVLLESVNWEYGVQFGAGSGFEMRTLIEFATTSL